MKTLTEPFTRTIADDPTDRGRQLVYADFLDDIQEFEAARIWRDQLPERHGRSRKRIGKLTEAEKKKFPHWVEKWIQVGLCTDPANRLLFEAGAAACYRFAGLACPRFVWCANPLVTVFAGSQFDNAVRGAVGGAVSGAVRNTVHGAVGGAVGGAVDGAVGDAVGDAVRGAVGGAVDGAVGGAVHGAVGDLWWRYLGGQFWVGGWYWTGSPSVTTYFLDALRLRLSDDIELRARAYAATARSACWWWPHRDVVFVSERPRVLRTDPLYVEWEGFSVGAKEGGK